MGIQSKSTKIETSVVGAVIAAVCIVIYLGALVQASVRFYLSIDQRRITADQEFTAVVDIALVDGKRGFMDERFIQTMNNALASSKSIEALIISGPEGEYAFERNKGYAVNWVNNSPRFINRWAFSDAVYNRPLSINNLRNVNIKAVAGAFDYYELSGILKETLLIILVGFAVAFFTMLLQLLSGKQNEAPALRAYKHTPVRETVREPIREQPARETVSAARDVPKETEHANIEEETIASGPKGLYSPRSGIGWEEYIKDRLESELHRCASAEKDLTLILIEFTDITNDAMYKQAAEDTVAFFTSRDLLFEYGRYGVSIILPEVNLDTAISKSEKFYQRVIGKISSNRKSSSGICIGISSRSGRLLNGGRLILEAGEALNKAREDRDASIIAFKSDIDKYRTFIASRNQTRP